MKQIAIITGLCFLLASQLVAEPLWLRYSAISPDGKQIAFSYKGDIYLVNSSGGEAKPLTLDDSYEFMPVWSHDGKSVAFASDRYGNMDVFVAPVTGGDLKRLTHHSSDDFPTDFTVDDNEVLFNSWRVDLPKYAQFPNSRMPELYAISTKGGMPRMVLTTPSEEARFNKDGSKIFYQDRKGYEDQWRKHHQSSIARDLWVYDVKGQKHSKITDFSGEDRSPIISADEKTVYFLSEASGSFNVYKMPANGGEATQLTEFDTHPVRFLSVSNDGTICFSYDGELYTMKEGQQPNKVDISIFSIRKNLDYEIVSVSSGISEMALAPNGKEFVFVKRGEVFVSSVDGGTTKRITNTPEQERSVSFSPDGKKILYAGERNGSWNIYETKVKRQEEPYFYTATILEETPLVSTDATEFQPMYSPDGKKVAYLEDRTTVKMIELESGKKKTLLPANRNYSYSDGDISYSWSPDSKWLAADMNAKTLWIGEVGVINTETGELHNVTNSGYSDYQPKWAKDGSALYWGTDRDGMKNHGSWGSENDVYAILLNQEAYDRFNLNKEEYDLWKEQQKKDKEKEKEEDKDSKKKEEDKEEVTPVVIDFENLDKRKERLTMHSSRMSDALLSEDGESLYYLARFEQGLDLWVTKPRTKETKMLVKMGANTASMMLDKEGKSIFVLADGKAYKVDAEKGDKKPLSFNGEMELKKSEERAYIFNHAWKQVKEKFYVKDLHGVDWDLYKKEYVKFLPHISNNYDFAEMLSEMLGELNASHTGCRYRPGNSGGDQTPSLGLFYDEDYEGAGLKVVEVLKDGPSDKAELKITPGVVLKKIDGVVLTDAVNYYALLNRKSDQHVLLSFYNPSTKKRYDEVVKPVSRGTEYNLLYERWVDNRKKEVAEASGGKVGYVHVRGMNNPSFRTVYEEVLGENADKESLIVDTRSNGGGWLHDDLATFLSGKIYIEMVPRGQHIGHEPQFKWTKPSAVLVGESNYSDAHMFPYTYRAMGIGKIVGMPVPGTGTAVWWEQQIDPSLVFGIPQVGMVDTEGDYLENKQLEPDVKVKNSYEMLVQGKDEQLRKAVELLMAEKQEKPDEVEIDRMEKGEK